jgi:hypothetical protein
MSRVSIAQRFWGGVGQRILDSGVLDGTLYKPGQTADESARLSEYDRRWAYYLNDDLYGRLYRAGLAPAAMPVEWNPVPAVVGFYTATTLFGELTIQPTDEDADAENLAAAVEQLWRWSNMKVLGRDVVVTATTLGDVFLKVAERVPSPEEPAVGVYMQDIPPQNVRWWDVDGRGYLTAIRIDTPRLESVFTGEQRRHTLVEVWRKEWPDGEPGGVHYYEIPVGSLLDDSKSGAPPIQTATFNELGYDFIPIVWARVDCHWRRQVAGIDRFNALAWQAARLNRPLIIVSAGGMAADGRPLAPPLGVAEGLESLYTEEGDGVAGVLRMPGAASMSYAGNPIDFAALNLRMSEVREGVIDALPEYRAATLKGIQIATETLQLLLNQAEQRVIEMRDVLERAFVRAQMMAISIAQLAELPGFEPETIGTYEDGRIEHIFTPRPVFGKSSAAKAEEAATLVTAGATLEGAAVTAGYSEAEAAQLVNLSTAVFPEEARRVVGTAASGAVENQ